MKTVNWGSLYNKYKDKEFDSNKLESEIIKLIQDEDVTKISGIYYYLITNESKYLSLRSFKPNQKRLVFEEQDGLCPKCQKICKKCNGTKSNN